MPLNKTYKLDTTSLVWTEVKLTDPMEPRGYLTSTAVGNYIVFYGGTTDTEVYTDARVLNTGMLVIFCYILVFKTINLFYYHSYQHMGFGEGVVFLFPRKIRSLDNQVRALVIHLWRLRRRELWKRSAPSQPRQALTPFPISFIFPPFSLSPHSLCPLSSFLIPHFSFLCLSFPSLSFLCPSPLSLLPLSTWLM